MKGQRTKNRNFKILCRLFFILLSDKSSPFRGRWGPSFIIFAPMDAYRVSQFESKLAEIYNNSTWLRYELTLHDFINLFPIKYVDDRPAKLDRPEGLDLDRDTYLAVLVAFRQAFG